jgi:hypothetical protein
MLYLLVLYLYFLKDKITTIHSGCKEWDTFTRTGRISKQRRLFAQAWHPNAANEDGARSTD